VTFDTIGIDPKTVTAPWHRQPSTVVRYVIIAWLCWNLTVR